MSSFLGSIFSRLHASSPFLGSSPTKSIQGYGKEVEEGLDLALDFLTDADERLQLVSPSKQPLSPSKPHTTSLKVAFLDVRDSDYHFSDASSDAACPSRPLPSPTLRPRKSILKPSKPSKPSSLNMSSSEQFTSFKHMVDSVLSQLAAGDEQARIRAYQSFLNAVQAKSSPLDDEALLKATPSFLEFTCRDVHSDSTCNSQIPTWALKFLANLAKMVPVANQADFEGFGKTLTLSIAALMDPTVPKAIIHHHMLYICQRFNPKILTAERVSLLMTTLCKLHERFQGSCVRIYRLIIYRQCLETAPQYMTPRAAEWLPNMLNCLISNKADIRQHAANLGNLAALKHSKSLCRVMEDILDSKHESSNFMLIFSNQLEKMLSHSDKDLAVSVPRTWIIVALFLRHRFHKPEFWLWFKPWLTLCSKAINSPDRQIKLEAYSAWKRFIFAVMPDRNTITQVRLMLRSPFADPLPKQRELQQGQGRAIMSGYLCLLYYALRPSATFEDCDLFWDEYVAPIVTNLTSPKRQGRQHIYCAASILQSLFSSQEKWSENRANTPQPIEIDELPRLDPRWVRSRLPKILPLIQTILTHSGSWSTRDVPERNMSVGSDTLASATWSALLDSVRDASSKEIRASPSLKSSIAAMTNTLTVVAKWLEDPDNMCPYGEEFGRFRTLVDSAITRLGFSTFLDCTLVSNTDTSMFEIAIMPSNQPSNIALVSPFSLLFEALMNLSLLRGGIVVDYFECLVERAWNAVATRTLKLQLAADLMKSLKTLLPNDCLPDQIDESSVLLASLVADICTPAMTGLNAPALTDRDFDLILAVCRDSLFISLEVPQLYSVAVEAANQLAGVGGILLAVTEPHSAMLRNLMDSYDGDESWLLLDYARTILDHDVRPQNWGAVARGRKALSNKTVGINKADKSVDEAFNDLSSLIDLALRHGYANLDSDAIRTNSLVNLIQSLMQYSTRIPGPPYLAFLKVIQNGFATMLMDPKSHIANLQNQFVVNAISEYWADTLELLLEQRTNCLSDFEHLLVSGLTSPSQSIVNATVIQNRDRNLNYPPNILSIIEKLQFNADFYLPSNNTNGGEPRCVRYDELGDTTNDGSDDTTEELLDTRDIDFFDCDTGSTTQAQPSSNPPQPRPAFSCIKDGLPALLNTESTLHNEPQDARRKLRHEDSQIDFETIRSLPIPTLARDESQNYTEHQKEVASRQHADATTLFSEIGAGKPVTLEPRSTAADQSLQAPGHVEIDSDSGQSDVLVNSSDIDEISSSPPTSPPIHRNRLIANEQQDEDKADESLQSSPVTASLQRRQERLRRSLSIRSEDHKQPHAEIPSSPPASGDESPMCKTAYPNSTLDRLEPTDPKPQQNQSNLAQNVASRIPDSYCEVAQPATPGRIDSASQVQPRSKWEHLSSDVMLVKLSPDQENNLGGSFSPQKPMPNCHKRLLSEDFNEDEPSTAKKIKISEQVTPVAMVPTGIETQNLGAAVSPVVNVDHTPRPVTSVPQLGNNSICEDVVPKAAELSAFSCLGRFEELIVEARLAKCSWTAEEQRRLADLAFEFQALSRGR